MRAKKIHEIKRGEPVIGSLGVGERAVHAAWNALRDRWKQPDDIDNPANWLTLDHRADTDPKAWPGWFVNEVSEMLDARPWDIYTTNMHNTFSTTDTLLLGVMGRVREVRIAHKSSLVNADIMHNREAGVMLIDVRTGASGVGDRYWAVRGPKRK